MEIDKYKNGQFKLKSKHLFAKTHLENIKNYILTSNNLLGGSNFTQDSVNQKLNSWGNEFMTTDEFNEIRNLFIQAMRNTPNLIIKETIEVFSSLMYADQELVNTFNKYVDFATNEKYQGIQNRDEIKKQLLNIQKNLFKLQAKIIFNKLRYIKEVETKEVIKEVIKESNIDIKPLFDAIGQKIEAMNNYINEQENELNKKTDSIAVTNVEQKQNLEQKQNVTNTNTRKINEPSIISSQTVSNTINTNYRQPDISIKELNYKNFSNVYHEWISNEIKKDPNSKLTDDAIGMYKLTNKDNAITKELERELINNFGDNIINDLKQIINSNSSKQKTISDNLILSDLSTINNILRNSN